MRLVYAVAALGAAAGCSATEGVGDMPPSAADAAEAAPELLLPSGFEATVVFEGTGESREIFIRDDGDLFVSLSGLRDGPHILGLRDEDGDHVIDVVEPFHDIATPPAQKVPRVHIEYQDGYLYAVDNERVVRMALPDGALSPVGETDIIVERIPYQSSHRGRTLAIDPDG
jgi:glucose/arabinose dehydrogenase